MLTEPKLEFRKEQPYLAIRTKVNMKDVPTILPPLIPEVLEWIDRNEITSAGPAFFQYLSMNDRGDMEVEVGVPVKDKAMADGRIVAGSFPSGKYATLKYFGDYRHLKEAHMAMESWLSKKGLKEKQKVTGNGITWGGRIEFYITDPQVEPDPEKWETEVVFLLQEDVSG